MRIAHLIAVALAVAPTSALALVVDDYLLEGNVFDDAADPGSLPFPGNVGTPLTQSLSPLVDRTLMFDSTNPNARDDFLSVFAGTIFFDTAANSEGMGTISYAFRTVLDVTGGATGFSFGTGQMDAAGLNATLEVVDAAGNTASSGPSFIGSTPGPVAFAYSSFAGVDLSTIKSVTLSLDALGNGVDGTIGDQFTAEGGSLAPIPLPAGLPLLVAGLGGLALLRRRAA